MALMISAATDEETGCTNQREFHPHPHIVHHLGVLLFPLVRQSDHLGLAADRKIRATEGIRALGTWGQCTHCFQCGIKRKSYSGAGVDDRETWGTQTIGRAESLPASAFRNSDKAKK